MQGLQTGFEPLYFRFNNALRPLGLLRSGGDVGSNRFLQIVNVVNENAIKLVHLRIDVPGHSNVDEKHGTVLPSAQKHFAMLAAENGNRGPGRSDHDIGLLAMVVERIEPNCGSAKACSQL